MENNQEEGFRSKTFETGQSSKGSNRGRKDGRRKAREQRGRGRPRQTSFSEDRKQPQGKRKREKKSIRRAVHEAEQVYNLETNEDIRKIIDAMEDRVLEEPSDPKMDEWSSQLPDPGNTRGRLTLYRRALHTYWVLTHLLAKAMEQVAAEMVEMAQEVEAVKKEVAHVEGVLHIQNEQIKEIQEMLKELVKNKDNIETTRGCAGN